jgi:hypothetical protein
METNIVDVQRKKYKTISDRPPKLHTFWFLEKIMLHEVHVSESVPMTQLTQKTCLHIHKLKIE